MLTAMYRTIATEIAKHVGLVENVISASSLKLLIRSNPIEAAEAVDEQRFAEVYPEEKYTIVKSFQPQNALLA